MNEYKISSPNAVAYLEMHNIKPIRIEKEKCVKFVYNYTNEFKAIMDEYNNEDKLKLFIESLKNVRNTIRVMQNQK